MSNENKQNDERADLPRYTEWMHLREHGQWSDGVPHWARDHTGRMNDFTAANAVIEELAARATQQATKGDERAAFERHWYDFYHSGSIRARSDGRYMQPAVQAAWDAWQARATTPSTVAGSAGQAPKTISAQEALAAIDDFEIVGDNNDSREPTDEDCFLLSEFIAHCFDGYRLPEVLPDDRSARVAIAVKDLIETLMLWNGQASAGLDVRFLAGLRDELSSIADAAPTAPSLATDAGAVLSDLQRATIQAAADSAHRVLIAGGDGGDELSDAGLRRELKESRDMLRALLAAHPTEQRMSDAARECEWTYDDVDFKWDSACGESWVFNDDGPVENKVRFCHGCGGCVTIAAARGESA